MTTTAERATGLWAEFRAFVARGSAFDLAVGVVLGAAFGTVVSSLVNDVLMPPIGLLTGGIDFSALFLDLSGGGYETLRAAREASAPVIAYGSFLNHLLSFLLVSAALFLVVRQYNRLRERERSAPAEPTDRECPYCRYRIPRAARRCPHCTSGLAGEAPGPAEV